MKTFWSIKNKLIIALLCTSLIPISVITAIHYFQNKKTLTRYTLDNLTAIAESKMTHIVSLLEAKKGRTIDFSSDGFIRDRLEKINFGKFSSKKMISSLNRHLLANKLPLDSHIDAIAVLDSKGRVVASTDNAWINADMSNEEIFKQGMKIEPMNAYVSQVTDYSPYIKPDSFYAAVPVTSRRYPGMGIIGLIVNSYNMRLLNEITTNYTGLGKTEEVYLVNKDKIMLTDSRFISNASLRQRIDTAPVNAFLQTKKTMTGIYSDYRGVSVVGASSYIPEFDWILLAEIDEAEAFESLKIMGLIALSTGCATGILVTAFSIVFSLSMARPIKKLTIATNMVANSDFSYRVRLNRRDELGELSRSFNFMADELAQETYKLSRSIEQSPNAVMITDVNGNIEYVNPKFVQMTGYKPEEVKGKNPRILNSGTRSREEYKKLWETITAGGEWHGEFQNRKKDGSFYWAAASISAVKDRNGVVKNFIGIQEDITEKKRLQEQFRNTVERSRDGIVVVDKEGFVRFANESALIIFSYDSDQLTGTVFGFPIITDVMTEIEIPKKNGTNGIAEMSIMKTEWDEKEAFLIIIRDVTERKKSERRIRQLAYYDHLTGLPNKMLYIDRLKQSMSGAQRSRKILAVLYLDLDRFKTINDTLGHSAGDRLLKIISERLVKLLRQEDTVTRIGGDEFTVLLPGLSQVKDAARIANKILAAIRQPLMLNNYEINISSSIGIAIYPNDGSDADLLLKNADLAMYHAKNQGRDNFQFYASEMSEKISGQLVMENDLRKALKRDELLVYYQPKVNTFTGQLSGVEALIRWKHPEKGFIEPSAFIRSAEFSGLIIPIGEWVLYTACKQNREWQDAGHEPFNIAVNLSAGQFQQKDLVEMISNILKETGMKSNYLELEVTESTAMKDVLASSEKMKSLSDIGVSIAIDDLGTGYSSLSYLKKFPIQSLKIDQSFVRDVTTDKNDAAIVSAIIAMAKGLKLKVVAEGVETQEQYDFLRQHQCDELQGYLFGKPVSAKEFEEFFQVKKAINIYSADMKSSSSH
ncbi:MAG: EAL domain-containing protein [Planctomycetes bacterium]|nr:EAL domain-containing protein [Planctomycetota bacterium]